MFKFGKVSGIVSDMILENVSNVEVKKNSANVKNHKNLNFYIDEEDFTLSFAKSKIVDDGDKIKLLYLKIPFAGNQVLTIKNITKKRDDYSKRMTLMFSYIFNMLLAIAFFGGIFYMVWGGKSDIFTLIPIITVAIFVVALTLLVMSVRFMQKNKNWLMQENF